MVIQSGSFVYQKLFHNLVAQTKTTEDPRDNCSTHESQDTVTNFGSGPLYATVALGCMTARSDRKRAFPPLPDILAPAVPTNHPQHVPHSGAPWPRQNAYKDVTQRWAYICSCTLPG